MLSVYDYLCRRVTLDKGMASAAIATAIKMIESLPQDAQDRVIEHLREYLEDLKDERRWDRTFKKSQPQLTTAAERARKEIAEGLSKPLNPGDL
jgi:gamma-glutamyl:cysteine ligase YbdK (ATP-grasp superfamily)